MYIYSFNNHLLNIHSNLFAQHTNAKPKVKLLT